MRKIAAIILAAGRGTRMGGDIPKALLEIDGTPIIIKSLKNLYKLDNLGTVVVVVGFKADLVMDVVKRDFPQVRFVIQKELLGTGHALHVALDSQFINESDFLLLFADDSSFYSLNTLSNFVNYHYLQNSKITMLVSRTTASNQLGGLRISGDGIVEDIITKENLENINDQRFILCGAFCLNSEWIKRYNGEFPINPNSNEYPLPSGLIYLSRKYNELIRSYLLEDTNEWKSINTPEEYENAKNKIR